MLHAKLGNGERRTWRSREQCWFTKCPADVSSKTALQTSFTPRPTKDSVTTEQSSRQTITCRQS
eukprot:5806096-Pleurochrysis_carterae.AAC.1